MGLIRAALRRPVTVLTLAVALAGLLGLVVALMRMRVDILPDSRSADDLRRTAV